MSEYIVKDPNTGEYSTVISNDSEAVHGVDASGNYLGLVPKGSEFLHVSGPPSKPEHTWDFNKSSWVHILSLEQEKAIALNYLDNIAGSTRLRFITEVPGQQAVYITKLEECKAYLADNNIVGPYLQAEASATGQSLHDTASYVIAVSNYWNSVIGPTIEATRRKAKIDVAAATTIAEVLSIKETAKASLDSL